MAIGIPCYLSERMSLNPITALNPSMNPFEISNICSTTEDKSKDLSSFCLCRNKHYLCVGINVGINGGITDGINHVQTTLHRIGQGHQPDCEDFQSAGKICDQDGTGGHLAA